MVWLFIFIIKRVDSNNDNYIQIITIVVLSYIFTWLPISTIAMLLVMVISEMPFVLMAFTVLNLLLKWLAIQEHTASSQLVCYID